MRASEASASCAKCGAHLDRVAPRPRGGRANNCASAAAVFRSTVHVPDSVQCLGGGGQVRRRRVIIPLQLNQLFFGGSKLVLGAFLSESIESDTRGCALNTIQALRMCCGLLESGHYTLQGESDIKEIGRVVPKLSLFYSKPRIVVQIEEAWK